MDAMTPEEFSRQPPEHPATFLAGRYFRTLLWVLLGILTLWLLGIEGIYGHPAPFYAAPSPAFSGLIVPGTMALLGVAIWWGCSARTNGRPRAQTVAGMLTLAGLLLALFYQYGGSASQWRTVWETLRWHLLALAVFLGALAAWLYTLRRVDWWQREPGQRETAWMLLGLVTFAAVFACCIAMLRGGPAGISQAYMRASYEYVGDIGVSRGIGDLFGRYLELRPHLSMHAKVHPPGPIALLWILSYLVGREPMALSLATVVVGSLAVLPLHGWVHRLTGDRRIALTTCAVYACMPSVVLFTATSADILFTPVTLTTLYCFTRAIQGPSAGWALSAGTGFFVMSILKFSLIGVGAWFAFTGIYLVLWKHRWWAVIQTAILMIAAFLALHTLLWLTTGFDMIGAFLAAKAQFDLDQHNLDLLTPRMPAWAWKFMNPLAWLFFAGIPVSVLAIWRIRRPGDEFRALWICCLLTFLALDLLYLARGEGERSALYVFPFLALPAAHALHNIGAGLRSTTPLAATLAFLAAQTWGIEAYLYTYW